MKKKKVCKDKMKRKLKEIKNSHINDRQRSFLEAVHCGPSGFVNYFQSWGIPENLLRCQTRESASLLLVEELTELQVPPQYLSSLFSKKWLLFYGETKDAIQIGFSDLFFDSENTKQFNPCR
jgi:hypothetical protein